MHAPIASFFPSSAYFIAVSSPFIACYPAPPPAPGAAGWLRGWAAPLAAFRCPPPLATNN